MGELRLILCQILINPQFDQTISTDEDHVLSSNESSETTEQVMVSRKCFMEDNDNFLLG